MARIPPKTALSVLIPALLFVLFALIVSFPDRVPFLNPSLRSEEGLGTEGFTVPGIAGTRASRSFAMKRVPAGIAPGGTLDVPGALRVETPFWLGRTEVTRGLYRSVARGAAAMGYELDAGIIRPDEGDDVPVEGISWAGAVVWCNLLSELCSLEPVYRAPGPESPAVKRVSECLALCAGPSPSLVRDSRAKGFRLPESAEWELAARYRDGTEWTSGTWPSGGIAGWEELSRDDLVAWFDRDGPAAAASLASNALGIYDMSGNVWEWCFDAFGEEPGRGFGPAGGEPRGTADAAGTGTTGGAAGGGIGRDAGSVATTSPGTAEAAGPGPADSPAGEPLKRVTRGGSWTGRAWRIQIGGAFGSVPDLREIGQGFRLARNAR